MRHESLPDVAAVSLVVFALWLCPAPLSIVGILQTAGPFLRASPPVSLVAVLLAVLLAVVALLAGRFLMSQFPYLL